MRNTCIRCAKTRADLVKTKLSDLSSPRKDVSAVRTSTVPLVTDQITNMVKTKCVTEHPLGSTVLKTLRLVLKEQKHHW